MPALVPNRPTPTSALRAWTTTVARRLLLARTTLERVLEEKAANALIAAAEVWLLLLLEKEASLPLRHKNSTRSMPLGSLSYQERPQESRLRAQYVGIVFVLAGLKAMRGRDALQTCGVWGCAPPPSPPLLLLLACTRLSLLERPVQALAAQPTTLAAAVEHSSVTNEASLERILRSGGRMRRPIRSLSCCLVRSAAGGSAAGSNALRFRRRRRRHKAAGTSPSLLLFLIKRIGVSLNDARSPHFVLLEGALLSSRRRLLLFVITRLLQPVQQQQQNQSGLPACSRDKT